MVKIREIKAKSIIVRSNLPEGDFVINPYIGCTHGCEYCYARFMKRFTGHTEPWGSFVDVKINAPDLIPTDTNRYRNKSITIGSVTDPYQPVERRYKFTRRILEKLVPLQPEVDIMTKSDLVLRDVDLLKQFKHCIVAFSISSLDDRIRRELESRASPAGRRLDALKVLHRAGIKMALFVSPILPGLTDWQRLIKESKGSVGEYWFENLNLYPSIRRNIYQFLRGNYPKLVGKYEKIYSKGSDYWRGEEKAIRDFCRENKVNCRIYFHHKIAAP